MKFLFLLVFILLSSVNLVLGFDLKAIEELRKLQEALKQTQKRLETELKGKSEKDLKSKEVQKRVQEVFKEEYEKAMKVEGGQDLNEEMLKIRIKNCENMKKRKEDLLTSASKKIIGGAIVGAALGAAAAGKDRRSEGAIIGAVTGTLIATAHEIWTKKDLFDESPDKLAKRVKYDPAQGLYLKIGDIKLDKSSYKLNEDIRLILRVEYLSPESFTLTPKDTSSFLGLSFFSSQKKINEAADPNFLEVKIKAYLVKEEQEIFIAEEQYSIPPGTTPFLYVFPVCEVIPLGEHKIKFVIEGQGVKDEKIVVFNRI